MSQLPAVQDREERQMTYKAFGSDAEVKLSVAIVKQLLVTPTKSGLMPSDAQVMRFMLLCRARALNPFEGDAFLVGYEKKAWNNEPVKAEFSLITAHQAFLKRAELSDQFDGMLSGVIVKDASGKMVDREGDFMHEGDVLLGGWATVHLKHRAHPVTRRVNLSAFQKGYRDNNGNFVPTSQWKDNPGGMICKVAEADSLRSAFPTKLGGLFMETAIPEVKQVGQPPRGSAAALNASLSGPARTIRHSDTPAPAYTIKDSEPTREPAPAQEAPEDQPVVTGEPPEAGETQDAAQAPPEAAGTPQDGPSEPGSFEADVEGEQPQEPQQGVDKPVQTANLLSNAERLGNAAIRMSELNGNHPVEACQQRIAAWVKTLFQGKSPEQMTEADMQTVERSVEERKLTPARPGKK